MPLSPGDARWYALYMAKTRQSGPGGGVAVGHSTIQAFLELKNSPSDASGSDSSPLSDSHLNVRSLLAVTASPSPEYVCVQVRSVGEVRRRRGQHPFPHPPVPRLSMGSLEDTSPDNTLSDLPSLQCDEGGVPHTSSPLRQLHVRHAPRQARKSALKSQRHSPGEVRYRPLSVNFVSSRTGHAGHASSFLPAAVEDTSISLAHSEGEVPAIITRTREAPLRVESRSEVGGAQTAGRSEVGGAQTAGRSEVGGARTAGRSEVGGARTAGRSEMGGAQTAGRSEVGGAQVAGRLEVPVGGAQTPGRSEEGGAETASRWEVGVVEITTGSCWNETRDGIDVINISRSRSDHQTPSPLPLGDTPTTATPSPDQLHLTATSRLVKVSPSPPTGHVTSLGPHHAGHMTSHVTSTAVTLSPHPQAVVTSHVDHMTAFTPTLPPTSSSVAPPSPSSPGPLQPVGSGLTWGGTDISDTGSPLSISVEVKLEESEAEELGPPSTAPPVVVPSADTRPAGPSVGGKLEVRIPSMRDEEISSATDSIHTSYSLSFSSLD